MKLITINAFVNGNKDTFYAHESDIETHHDIVKMRKMAAMLADRKLADTFEVFDKETNTRAFLFTFYDASKNYVSIYVDIVDVKMPCNAAA